MKRLVKKESMQSREFVIPTTPIYNPLGRGEENSEFKDTDDKSYSRMFNNNTMELIDKKDKQNR